MLCLNLVVILANNGSSGIFLPLPSTSMRKTATEPCLLVGMNKTVIDNCGFVMIMVITKLQLQFLQLESPPREQLFKRHRSSDKTPLLTEGSGHFPQLRQTQYTLWHLSHGPEYSDSQISIITSWMRYSVLSGRGFGPSGPIQISVNSMNSLLEQSNPTPRT